MEATAVTDSGKSLTTLAFERLHADILCGDLRPSERLRIQSLSQRYEVGATAIREALSRLVTDGLVELEDQRGFCVAPVSREELLDLTQTRIDVESLALAGAIERGTVEWETRILSSFHRLSRTAPSSSPELRAQRAVAHRQFHESLVDGCGSPSLLRLCRMLFEKTERYRNLAEGRSESSGRDTLEEHRRLMDATMGRDVVTATRLLAEHFRETTNIILRTNFAATPRAAGKAGKVTNGRPSY